VQLIICAIMIWLGQGPIKGFGVTLAIGVVSTLFSVLITAHLLMELLIESETLKKITMRKMLGDLAAAERDHMSLAQKLGEKHLTADAKSEEEETRRRMFVLQVVQPGLAGLMDGSVSTLAPLFAAAFATHDNWKTFLVGMAASVGAGISMGFAEALSDDGELTGRGHPWLRGGITGLMTMIGGALVALINMMQGITGTKDKEEKPEFQIIGELIQRLESSNEPMSVTVDGNKVTVQKGGSTFTSHK